MSDIVRQGSVYGPQICISSMDKINLIGKDITTFYAPDLPIKAGVFVDDVTGLGGVTNANRLIFNCNIMEERKKMVFNNKTGKTEYMVITGKNKEEIRTISSQVKKGVINRVNEHKMLGTWFNETGRYGINILKREENLQYMISTVKWQASPDKIGVYSVQARLKLAEIVIIRSVLYNAEAFEDYTESAIKQLESIQLKILTGILELPSTTPYCALLMEVGWWTMRARVAYQKLMLYHNILRSDTKRTLQKLLIAQEKEARETTWFSNVQREIKKYSIELDPKESLKSTWKKEVKNKINKRMEEEIREKCKRSTKSRIVLNDKYEKKEYLLSKVSLPVAKKILRTRMNMVKVPGNYKGNGEGICPLCETEEGSTEHYFRCSSVRLLVKVWDVKEEDLVSQEIQKMKDVSNFFEKVQTMINPEIR